MTPFAVTRFRTIACVLVAGLALGLTQACAAKEDKVKHSAEELKKFLTLPVAVDKATFEIATLPESGGSDLPGPTDYVVLVAAVQLADAAQKKLLDDLPAYTGRTGVEPAFARPWLSADEKIAIQSKDTTQARDVSRLLVRKAKRAYAVPAANNLVIYVEYVAPY